MKTKQYFLIGALGIALTGVILTGCKKNDTTTNTNPTDYTAAQDDATGADAIQDSKNISDGAAKGQAVDRILAGECEVVTKLGHDTMYNSQLDSCIIINFGPTDCICKDGRTRRGEIYVFWNGKPYFDPASVVSMTFKNYYLDDNGISGTRTLTNTGSNTWSFTAALTITYPNSQTATWNSTRYYSISTVNSVMYCVVTGPVSGYAANGTGRNGGTYNITITSPLYVVAPWWLSLSLNWCPYIEAGAVTVNVSSFSYPIYVNFGSASALGSNDCHISATATINGNNYSFNQ